MGGWRRGREISSGAGSSAQDLFTSVPTDQRPAHVTQANVMLLPSLPQGHISPPPPAPTTETAICCQGPGLHRVRWGAQGTWADTPWLEKGQQALAPLVKTPSLHLFGTHLHSRESEGVGKEAFWRFRPTLTWGSLDGGGGIS